MITTKTVRPPLGVVVGVADRVVETADGVGDADELAMLGLTERSVMGLAVGGLGVLAGEDEAGKLDSRGVDEGLGGFVVNSGRTGVGA